MGIFFLLKVSQELRCRSKIVPWGINPLADHNMVGYTLGIRRKALVLFDNRPSVGATWRHLFNDRERVAKMSYRYQKAWLWSVQVEAIKEEKRHQAQRRIDDIATRMAVLRAIGERGEKIERRTQQPINQYMVEEGTVTPK